MPIADISAPFALELGAGPDEAPVAPLPVIVQLDLDAHHLALDPGTLQALREWFDRRGGSYDGQGGQARTHWIVLPGKPLMAALVIDLFYEPVQGEVREIPFHLVFDLSDRRGNTVARWVADRHQIALTLDIRREEPTALFVNGQFQAGAYGNAIEVEVAANFYSALAVHTELALDAVRFGRDKFWLGLLGSTVAGLTVEVSDTWEWAPFVAERIGSRKLVETPGLIIELVWDTMLEPAAGADLPIVPTDPNLESSLIVIPADRSRTRYLMCTFTERWVPTGKVGKKVVGRKEPAMVDKPGWRHQAIGLVTRVEGTPGYVVWELGVAWREMPGVEPSRQITNHLRDGRARRKTPTQFWPAVAFLAATGHLPTGDVYRWLQTFIETYDTAEELALALWGLRRRQRESTEPPPSSRGSWKESRLLEDMLTLLFGQNWGRLIAIAEATETVFYSLMLDNIPMLWASGFPNTLLSLPQSTGDPAFEKLSDTLTAMLCIGLWSDSPPELSLSTPWTLSETAAGLWFQRCVLNDPTAHRLDAGDAHWLQPEPATLWAPWARADVDAWPFTITDDHIRRIRALCGEHARAARTGIHSVVGRFIVKLPAGIFPRLEECGVTTISVVAREYEHGGLTKVSVWARLGPDDPRHGVVVPFIPGEAPLNSWALVLPQGPLWEAFLALSCWWRDMRDAGEVRVLEPTERTPQERGAGRAPGRNPDKAPSPLRVPRRTILRHPGTPRGFPLTKTGTYGRSEDREAVSRQLASLQTVRPHTFHPAKREKFTASDEKRRAWALLDPTTRIKIAGSTEFPEKGTIRGLRLVELPDGGLAAELGYRRGLADAETPRPVVSATLKALETAAVLLEVLERERAEDDLRATGERDNVPA